MKDETFLYQRLEEGSHVIEYFLKITNSKTVLRIQIWIHKGTNKQFYYEVNTERLPLSWNTIQDLIMLGSYADTDLVNFSKCLEKFFQVLTLFPGHKLVDNQAYWQISNSRWLNLLEPVNRRAK